MARYIDADKLTDKLEELQFNAPVMTPVMKIYNVIELIEDQPTADVVEVKHGEWVKTGDRKLDVIYSGQKCSVCGYVCCGDKTNYCPNCGADMGGKMNGQEQIWWNL